MSALPLKAEDIAATSTSAMVPISSARSEHKRGKYVRATVLNALAVLAFTNQEGGPMPFTETTRITLVAAQDVDLHTGIVMPRGSYPGTRTRTRVSYLDGSVNWTPTRYRIELTAEQLASMGAIVQPNQSSEEIDVTEFVRSGLLKPT
jgi:hypothetical protein